MNTSTKPTSNPPRRRNRRLQNSRDGRRFWSNWKSDEWSSNDDDDDEFAESEAFSLRSSNGGETDATLAHRIPLSLGERAGVRAEFPVLKSDRGEGLGVRASGCGVDFLGLAPSTINLPHNKWLLNPNRFSTRR